MLSTGPAVKPLRLQGKSLRHTVLWSPAHSFVAFLPGCLPYFEVPAVFLLPSVPSGTFPLQKREVPARILQAELLHLRSHPPRPGHGSADCEDLLKGRIPVLSKTAAPVFAPAPRLHTSLPASLPFSPDINTPHRKRNPLPLPDHSQQQDLLPLPERSQQQDSHTSGQNSGSFFSFDLYILSCGGRAFRQKKRLQ